MLRLLQPGQPYRRFGDDVERHADCRIVAGFSIPPEEMERTDRLPLDWQARFDVRIDIPPLDARREDIPLLVRSFVAQFMSEDAMKNSGVSIRDIEPSAEKVASWVAAPWGGAVGNVRGLKKAVNAYLRTQLRLAVRSSGTTAQTSTKKMGRPRVRDISDENLVGLLRQVTEDPSRWTADKLFDQIDMRMLQRPNRPKKTMKRTRDNLQTRIRNIEPEVFMREWPATGTLEDRKEQVYKALQQVRGFLALPR